MSLWLYFYLVFSPQFVILEAQWKMSFSENERLWLLLNQNVFKNFNLLKIHNFFLRSLQQSTVNWEDKAFNTFSGISMWSLC